MESVKEEKNIIDEVAHIFAVGYMRLFGIRDRCEPPLTFDEPAHIFVETSPEKLDIPEMSSNL